ncbi:MAG: 2-phospho-L-lactate transferase CofD family protein [Halieaceae bacterium]|nr:2-phospho-L-lactate transferase CofD family protein [Halieaceae bacterium]
MAASAKVLALSGGVGGAKLALGLSMVTDPQRLTVVANTGDDFEHLGLTICPDLDSVMYALAGLNDEQRGWGVAGETWDCLASLGRLGGETCSSSVTGIWPRTCSAASCCARVKPCHRSPVPCASTWV